MRTEYLTIIPEIPIEKLRINPRESVSVFSISIVVGVICSIFFALIGYSVLLGFTIGFIVLFILISSLKIWEYFHNFKTTEKNNNSEDTKTNTLVSFKKSIEDENARIIRLGFLSGLENPGHALRPKDFFNTWKTLETESFYNLFEPHKVFEANNMHLLMMRNMSHSFGHNIRTWMRRIWNPVGTLFSSADLLPLTLFKASTIRKHHEVFSFLSRRESESIKEKLIDLVEKWDYLNESEKEQALRSIWHLSVLEQYPTIPAIRGSALRGIFEKELFILSQIEEDPTYRGIIKGTRK